VMVFGGQMAGHLLQPLSPVPSILLAVSGL
jgi:hypothetical protein